MRGRGFRPPSEWSSPPFTPRAVLRCHQSCTLIVNRIAVPTRTPSAFRTLALRGNRYAPAFLSGNTDVSQAVPPMVAVTRSDPHPRLMLPKRSRICCDNFFGSVTKCQFASFPGYNHTAARNENVRYPGQHSGQGSSPRNTCPRLHFLPAISRVDTRRLYSRGGGRTAWLPGLDSNQEPWR